MRCEEHKTAKRLRFILSYSTATIVPRWKFIIFVPRAVPNLLGKFYFTRNQFCSFPTVFATADDATSDVFFCELAVDSLTLSCLAPYSRIVGFSHEKSIQSTSLNHFSSLFFVNGEGEIFNFLPNVPRCLIFQFGFFIMQALFRNKFLSFWILFKVEHQG